MTNFRSFVAALGTATFVLALSAVPLRAASSPTTSTTSDPPDVYRVNYFLGLHSPAGNPLAVTGNDATINIVDPGSNGTGSICADIYVLNPSEELEACCGCSLTPDELISGPVVADLLSNNVSPIVLANGVIKVIASAPGAGGVCNPAAPVPTPTLREWLTRVDQAGPGGPTGVTTTEFSYAPLSTAEESSLATRCADIQAVGSTFGICTCPAEPPNNPLTPGVG